MSLILSYHCPEFGAVLCDARLSDGVCESSRPERSCEIHEHDLTAEPANKGAFWYAFKPRRKQTLFRFPFVLPMPGR